MTTADEYKAKGNAALQSNNLTLAIEHYTSAIDLDGANHVYYSNRSAAYLKKGDANNALKDAESCLGLNPDFAKGYSRKGAALHGLKRYNDSIAAYEEGLQKFPGDKGLSTGLEQVKREKDRPAFGGGFPAAGGAPSANPMAGLFGPDLMAKIAMDPKLRTYLSDADFCEKIKKLQADPNSLETMISDRRILEVFQMLLGGMGMGMKMPGDDDDNDDKDNGFGSSPAPAPASAATPASSASPKKEESSSKDTAMKETEEDFSDLTPEETEVVQKKKDAVTAKEKGNELYKSKKFDDAIAAYDEAIALDETNMTFHSNKAAVYFTQKNYDECITSCEKAVEIGTANRAPFEDRAKALVRCGKAHQKKGDLKMAIEKVKAAQLEHYDKAADRLLKTWELEKRKADALAYQDDEKAEEHKQKGNEHFRAQKWPEAVKEYEEAVKRAPKNAPIRNNLSAALCKIMDFNGAKREIETALDLDPTYVKAWARKGDIEVIMKENHKAMDSYKKGLELDKDNRTCQEGLRKVAAMINMGSANMTEEERKERAEHAMADPEIQAILTDPIIRQVLQDFQQNPQAANEAMRDPTVRTKIEKLVASGIVQTA